MKDFNTCREVVLSRKGIYIDGERLDRLVHAINYSARGGRLGTHRYIEFKYYVTNEDNTPIERDGDIVSESVNFVWLFEDDEPLLLEAKR
jgi:hypothetical protein